MRLTWPLTGRSEELRRIAAALSDDASSGIVICGPAGMGKSRLAREALRTAAGEGRVTHWVVGTMCARALPLGAFAEWVPADRVEAIHLVRGVIEALTTTSADRPVVIGIDDVHLLDELSTFVAHQLVQRSAAKLVLTVRDGDPIDAATQELWKDAGFDRLDVQPLASTATAALLSAALGGDVESASVSRLSELTLGNLLYLRQIVEREVADGRLARAHGMWQWSGEPTLPCGLIELIEAELGTLTGAACDVVDALAVGEPITVAALRRIAGADALEQADVHGLVAIDGDEVRVAHPLYGELRRNRAAPTRLRRLRGLVAAELATEGDADDAHVMVRRATLTVDSDLPPDAELFCNAAQVAIWLADLPLAERLAGAAVLADAGSRAQFLRAHALSWLGRGEEAEAVLAAVDTDGLTDDDHARLTYLRASNMLWALARTARAKEIIDTADRRGTAGWIDALETVYWFANDVPTEATTASKDLVLEALPPVVGTETAWALAAISADAGRTSDAVALAERGYAVATRCLDAPHMRFNVADSHLTALALAGRIDAAGDVAARVRSEASELPGVANVLGNAVAGRAALSGGRLDDACRLLGEASASLAASGHAIGWGFRYHVPHATALAMRGRIDEAAAVLDSLDRLDRPFRSLDYERALARAWITAGEGVIGEAIDILDAGAEIARANGRLAAEVMCLQTVAQLGVPSVEPRLHELADMVDGPRAGLAARFAHALNTADTGELSSVSEEFEHMGDLVAALDATAHAAVIHRGRDLRGSMLAASARAEALAERCGGADTPALRQAREPLPLTGREREIAMLVGAGLHSRDIAARLSLSPRTVEGHLYRAMGKTGTATRAELAALLRHHDNDD